MSFIPTKISIEKDWTQASNQLGKEVPHRKPTNVIGKGGNE